MPSERVEIKSVTYHREENCIKVSLFLYQIGDPSDPNYNQYFTEVKQPIIISKASVRMGNAYNCNSEIFAHTNPTNYLSISHPQ